MTEQATPQPTYEQLMSKSRELYAKGDMERARRLAEIALKRRSGGDKQVFEVQGQDDRIHAVEADSMEQAAQSLSGIGSENVELLKAKGRQAYERGDVAMAKAYAELVRRQKSDQPDTQGTSQLDLARQRIEDAHKEKSFGQTLKENLVGDGDPNSHNFGEKVGQFLNKAGESLTFGLIGDEADAAARSVLSGRSYQQELADARQRQEVFERDNPGLSLAADLAPIAIPGAGIVKGAAKGASLGRQAMKGAGVAAAQGGLYGFMEGEGQQERLQHGKDAALLSAGMGGLAAPIANKAQNIAERLSVRPQVREMVRGAPSADDLSARAKLMYQRGQSRGHVLSAEQSTALASDVRQTLIREGVMRPDGSLITRDPDVKRILDELADLEQFGLTGNQVKPVREIFSAAAKDRNPTRARIGRIIRDKYDDAVAKIAPEFSHGDQLYARAKRAQAVDQIIDTADNSETANAMRREFQKVDRRNIKGENTPLGRMSDDEVAAMQRVARGTGGERMARKIGTAAPTSVGDLMFKGAPPVMAGGLAGDPLLGAVVSGAAMGAGAIGKAVSNRAQAKHADIVKALIATGGVMPQAQISDATRAIAEALVSRAAPRIGEMLVR